MIEKDNIQDLFSKAFENQTAPVSPDVWSGIQAKMAAAGVAGAGTAAKGISLLSKWLIGTGVVGSLGVAATIIVMNSDSVEKPSVKDTSEISTASNVGVEKTPTESSTFVARNPKTEQSNDMVSTNVLATDSVYIPVSENQYTPPVHSTKVIPHTDPVTHVVLTPAVEPTVHKTQTETRTSLPEKNPETEENTMVVLNKQVVEFPNIFTPNNDGKNDFYTVKIENVTEVEVRIMNQQNVVIYQSNDPDFRWDGTVNGDPCQNGMYVCIIVGKAENGKAFKDMQMFQVIR